ncbi:hypothetical protein, partial [Heyndrickxia sporothermodurans]|uniref:hypothetical protein n=1 Tax=Heyndrickxia sporothermodurans TaxID=46224 RepID=UPI001F4293A0
RTLLGARVAPQHCPIPLAGKNIYFSIVKNMVTKSFTQNNLHNHYISILMVDFGVLHGVKEYKKHGIKFPCFFVII